MSLVSLESYPQAFAKATACRHYIGIIPFFTPPIRVIHMARIRAVEPGFTGFEDFLDWIRLDFRQTIEFT